MGEKCWLDVKLQKHNHPNISRCHTLEYMYSLTKLFVFLRNVPDITFSDHVTVMDYNFKCNNLLLFVPRCIAPSVVMEKRFLCVIGLDASG